MLPPAAKPPVVIALDWGTSSLRGYLLDGSGTVADRFATPLGILNVPERDFAGCLAQTAAVWLRAYPQAPVLACGMIGSRQGWVEAPYLRLPAGAADIAAAVVTRTLDDGRQIHFVPGVDWVDQDGVSDVMRGEETQLLGMFGDPDSAGDRAGGATSRHIAVLPGTHSKWALVEDGRIAWFGTYMTGELFAVLAEHSILGRLMDGRAHDPAAFARGLEMAARGDRGFGRLFSARTLALTGALTAAQVAAYLSGLLIGGEVAEAHDRLSARPGAAGANPAIEAVTVIGASALAQRYAEALTQHGIAAVPGDEAAAASGLALIARLLGLLSTPD